MSKDAEVHADLHKALEEGEAGVGSRADVMRDIQEYVDACWQLDISPLQQLRRILPQYKWSYHKLKSQRAARQVVARSDFVWRANYSPLEERDGFELFTATAHINREPLKLVFFEQEDIPEYQEKKIALVNALGGNPEYY